MKKYIFHALFFVCMVSNAISQQICCPEFKLKTKYIMPCDQTECRDSITEDGAAARAIEKLLACKNQPQEYLVAPNLPGYAYTWTIIGGTLLTSAANPATIAWGSGSDGFIQVIIANADGSCRDTLKQWICLLDTPTAAITFNPNPVCLNSPVYFSGANSEGGTVYYWDFGDGTSSDLQDPPAHIYPASGNYTVTLTISNVFSKENIDCGCRDTEVVVITVSDKQAINIFSDCDKMLCEKDTAQYCTDTPGCDDLAWTINGGTLISGQGTTCILVKWDKPGEYPTSVTLEANCPNTCGNSSTLMVPVLYPQLPIQGQVTVCPGSGESYSLPALPGTFYYWTVSGGDYITGPDRNHNVINISWPATSSGPQTIQCNYFNPLSACVGNSSLDVTIKPRFNIYGPSRACAGNNSIFFAAGGGSADWIISPATGYTAGSLSNVSTLSLAWNTAGTYTITATPVTAEGYCTPSATAVIEVYPKPVLNPIVGDLIVCPGQLYTYSGSSNVTGGNFTWSFILGTGIVAPYGPNNSLASVVFSGTGPWTLQTIQWANGCYGISNLDVNPMPLPPAISLTASSICSGGSITASVPGTVPAGGYTWSSTPGAVLESGQGTTSAIFTVNYNADISLSNCSGSSTATVVATTEPVTINITDLQCSSVLTASPPGGVFTWFLDGEPVSNDNPYTVTQNGNYVLQAVYGTCIAEASATVTNITPVIANISITGTLCSGGTVTLIALVSANCPNPNYLWSTGATTNLITVTTPGDYNVKVSCDNGCFDISTITVTACSTSPGNCINDLVISQSGCSNPVALTVSTPSGCTPVSTNWSYGDETSGSTGNHLYNNIGSYTVSVVMECSDGTFHCGIQNIKVPMAAFFTSVVICRTDEWTIQLRDASSSFSGYSLLWSTSCGTLSANNTPDPELTVLLGCNPTVTLQISNPSCTTTYSYSFDLPLAALSIISPPTVCKGENYLFESSIATGLTYEWDFGDGTLGVTNPISHAFDGSSANPVITLIITDKYGCRYQATKPITVITPTPLVITPVEICPDCLPPGKLSLTDSIGYGNYQWYHNGLPIANANSATYPLCNFNASGNYYVTAISSPDGCMVQSNSTTVSYLPKPIANITFVQPIIPCIPFSGTTNLYVRNSFDIPGYTYSWTADPPATFSPNNTSYNATITISTPGLYQLILSVNDTNTGCMAKDTLCVYIGLSPTVTISTSGIPCEGITNTFTATALPPNPEYIYQWSNGASGPTMTTSQAGIFQVFVTNPETGCTGTGTVSVPHHPYLELFPLGCYTLCDTLCNSTIIIPPLPVDSDNPDYNNIYAIQWYVNGQNFFTGPQLSLSGWAVGHYSINIGVNFIGSTCSSTSGYYELDIINCSDTATCCDKIKVEPASDSAGTATCCAKITTTCAVKEISVDVTNGTLASVDWNCTDPVPTGYIGKNVYTFQLAGCIPEMVTCVNATTSGTVTISYEVTFTNGEKCKKIIELECNATDPCSATNALMIKKDTGECCYQVDIGNLYQADYFTGILITSSNLPIANASSENLWSSITYSSPTVVLFSAVNPLNGVPLNTSTLGTLCFSGTGTSNITVSFIGPAPAYDTICPTILNIKGCEVLRDTTCISIQDLQAECDDEGAYRMKFRITNNSDFTVRGIIIYSQTPDVILAPRFIPISDLLPDEVSVYYETLLNVSNNAKNACFFFAACDQNTLPGVEDLYPKNCCMDSIPYCVKIPSCDPCGDISITATSKDPSDCCYNLTLTSTFYPDNIGYLEFTGIGGTQFALLSGWHIISVGSSHIKIKAPVEGGVLPGIYPDFASFCLTGTSFPPFSVMIKSFDVNGAVLCTDTLNFEDCQLVEPTCANIINDSLYCYGDKINYTFYVKNNSPFPLYWIDLRTPDESIALNVNHVIPNPPIALGDTGGPYTVVIDSADINLETFCMYLTGHNGIYDPENFLFATECCTDSLGVVCLPMVKCNECDTTVCCDFANMTIPNGITPNDDGFNDTYEILNANCCEYISIIVFNRWGNIVYQNKDYKNDWKGVNESGKKLVQGTYFVLLELPTGNRKGIYVDIRY